MSRSLLTGRLFSPSLLPALFGGTAAAMIAHSLGGGRWAMTLVVGLLCLIAVSILGCSLLRFRSLRISTMLIHGGLLLIIVAGLGNGAGYTATANLYEGDTVTDFFRWDKQAPFSPGFGVRITELNQQWYPVEVRIGILRNGVKQALLTARSGTETAFADLTLVLGELNPQTRQLALSARDGSGRLWRGSIGREPMIVGDHSLLLVAFQPPVIRNLGARLQILENGAVRAEGMTAVNAPFTWNGLLFALTALNRDEDGRPYAGLQITSAPAWRITVAGFLITTGGLLLHLRHLFRPAKRLHNGKTLFGDGKVG